ncbi:YDG domain-containing protein [Roseateles sp. SL47]|uniref:YDG domain-containing protein n=1 Tax=Roseateles sp. SL47 TaxID=2995138 RepID=UPI00226E9D80|nr:YDG domain-containing protein [Roseateles sp. SL47]WAC74486.1 YDG domain-containing protein [Roseateles sp. SL47]
MSSLRNASQRSSRRHTCGGTAGRRHAREGAPQALWLVTLCLAAGAVQAGPAGARVTAGNATISQTTTTTTTTITQTSARVSLNWQSFNTSSQEVVHFVQPSANAIAVNRIADVNGTRFFGRLQANGQVFLINPNGVLFGATAQVNVGGLVASTLHLSDDSLAGSQRTFAGSGAGRVINQGKIQTADGGYVALLAAEVSNEGQINAPRGTVALGAGKRITLGFQDHQLLRLQVDDQAVAASAANGGWLQADGGQVLISAGARDSLLPSVVNNTGVVQARTLENRNGTIVLLGGMAAGRTEVGGTLDASAPAGGDGGFVETSAHRVHVADGARIHTSAAAGAHGTWLIDPVDFTVAATGGDITGTTLSTNLASGNVTLQSTSGTTGGTAGDININQAVSWSANTTLTLNAQNNIHFNADVTASGATGKLALQYGQSSTAGTGSDYVIAKGVKINLQAGSNFSTKLGSSGTTKVYTVITTLGVAGDVSKTTLQGINGDLYNTNANYVLGADIDATSTASWNAGAGFAAIGHDTFSKDKFIGTFSGLGHTITNLTVKETHAAGLFGKTQGGEIRDVGLVGGSVSTSGGSYAGGLIGISEGTLISNVYTEGMTSSGSAGLVGLAQLGTTLRNSYSTNTVTASSGGGLVGVLQTASTIANSYSAGSVSGGASGLVGIVNDTSSISNSYAAGSVAGGGSGLVTSLNGTASITNSYAAAAVSGAGAGLIGTRGASTTVTATYWDKTASGKSAAVVSGSATGMTGLTSTQMKDSANFSGWSLATAGGSSSVWRIYSGQTAPLLRSFLSPLTVTADSGARVYDATTSTGSLGVSYSTSTNANLLGSALLTLSSKDVGSRIVTASGLYSNQKGYDIAYVSGVMTITPAAIALSGLQAVDKVYDASSAATLSGTATVAALGSDVVNVSGTASASFANKNVGTSKPVTVSGLTLAGADAGNYTLVLPSSLSASITPASLAVTGLGAVGKVYDASTIASLSGTASVTALAGDTVTLSGTASGSFADKNVGTSKPVTVGGLKLAGADAGNYTLVLPSSLSASITPASLAVTGLGAVGKVYDASTIASLSGTASVTALAGDAVSLSGTASASFADKNVGTSKPVTVSGLTLAGADAGNYTLVMPSSLSASITPASLAVTGIGAVGRVYDASMIASLSGTASVTAQTGDAVTLSGTASASFADKNVGTSKPVTVSGLTLTGADAANYTLILPPTLAANITPAPLTITGVQASDKIYDGSRVATLVGVATVSPFAQDVVSLTGPATATFSDKDPGIGKPVTVTGYRLTGPDAGNYELSGPSGLSASIRVAAQSSSAIPLASGMTTAPQVADDVSSAPTLIVLQESQSQDLALLEHPPEPAPRRSVRANALLQIIDGGVRYGADGAKKAVQSRPQRADGSGS